MGKYVSIAGAGSVGSFSLVTTVAGDVCGFAVLPCVVFLRPSVRAVACESKESMRNERITVVMERQLKIVEVKMKGTGNGSRGKDATKGRMKVQAKRATSTHQLRKGRSSSLRGRRGG